MRPALGGEAAVHDRERALGVGTGDRGGEREVGAQPVVAHVVVELDAHAEEALAGAQLEHGAQLDGDGVVAAPGARSLVADRVRSGNRYVAVTAMRARTGPDSSTVTRHRLGRVDDRVGGGRAVVVGVAAVAAVDQSGWRRSTCTPSASMVSVPSVGIDLDAQVLVGEHRPARRTPPCSVPRRRRRRTCASRSPAPAPGANTTSCIGRPELADARSSRRLRRARAALRAVASRSIAGSPGAASCNVNSTTPSSRRRSSTRATRAPANSGPRIISSTQRIFCPIDDGGEALAGARRARPASAARCRRRGRRGGPARSPGSASSTTPPRSTADGFTTTVEPAGASISVGQRGERVVGQRLADVARLLVAHSHRLDDFVVAARARRVVRAVQHQVAPADVEQRVRDSAAAGRNSALSGSARRSSARSAAAAAWCTSTRFDATPISTLARAPERSSPHHVGSPSVGCAARYSGRDVIAKW